LNDPRTDWNFAALERLAHGFVSSI